MSKEECELIISKNPAEGENTMYITPSNLSSLKFLSSNTFDYCLIKDCPVSSITSLCLSQIFRIMKYQSRIEILVSQPMSVMQALDSKQIEAHCEHVGFAKISTEDAKYMDEKNGKEFPTVAVVCYKPSKTGEIDVKKVITKSSIITTKNKKYGK